jgi:peptide/nickel transport system substrate-binding protein
LNRIFCVLSKKELWLIRISLFLILASSAYLGFDYYLKNTETIPNYGGEYIEGMVGQQPRFINPVLSQTNDIDSDLSSLIYSSLLKLDGKGQLANDLVESYEVDSDNLSYTFRIKKGVKWHDEEDLKAKNLEIKDLNVDDIIYTIQTIQNPDFNSALRMNWTGIRTEKVDDYTIKFILKNAYSPFLNNLTFGVLPKHLWEFIGASNFPLAERNLRPIGSGPYKFSQFTKDKTGKISSIELTANNAYYLDTPLIEKLIFKFFATQEDAIIAFNRKEIKGISYLSPENKEKVADLDRSNLYRLSIPRYFAIFFNQAKSKALSDKTVRLALSYAIDKNKLIEEILKGEGSLSNSPIPTQLLGNNPNIKIYDYAAEHAKNTLEAAGWVDSDGDGVREKEDVKIEFTLIAHEQPEFSRTAELISQMWKEIGANVQIKTVQTSELRESFIKPREYEAILFAEILNYDPDPFAFWHSSQKKEGGLNLALYDNMEADKLLEEARQETNADVRAEKYNKFQELVTEDVPAIFLFSPNYLYLQNKSIQGVELENIIIPSDRFNGIGKWYLKTERVWK